MEDKRRQEIWCHNCNNHVQFTLDISLSGNFRLHCPNCMHEHRRMVRDGVITEGRWDVSATALNSATSNITYTQYSSYNTTGSATSWLANSWANTSSITGY